MGNNEATMRIILVDGSETGPSGGERVNRPRPPESPDQRDTAPPVAPGPAPPPAPQDIIERPPPPSQPSEPPPRPPTSAPPAQAVGQTPVSPPVMQEPEVLYLEPPSVEPPPKVGSPEITPPPAPASQPDGAMVPKQVNRTEKMMQAAASAGQTLLTRWRDPGHHNWLWTAKNIGEQFARIEHNVDIPKIKPPSEKHMEWARERVKDTQEALKAAQQKYDTVRAQQPDDPAKVPQWDRRMDSVTRYLQRRETVAERAQRDLQRSEQLMAKATEREALIARNASQAMKATEAVKLAGGLVGMAGLAAMAGRFYMNQADHASHERMAFIDGLSPEMAVAQAHREVVLLHERMRQAQAMGSQLARIERSETESELAAQQIKAIIAEVFGNDVSEFVAAMKAFAMSGIADVMKKNVNAVEALADGLIPGLAEIKLFMAWWRGKEMEKGDDHPSHSLFSVEPPIPPGFTGPGKSRSERKLDMEIEWQQYSPGVDLP